MTNQTVNYPDSRLTLRVDRLRELMKSVAGDENKVWIPVDTRREVGHFGVYIVPELSTHVFVRPFTSTMAGSGGRPPVSPNSPPPKWAPAIPPQDPPPLKRTPALSPPRRASDSRTRPTEQKGRDPCLNDANNGYAGEVAQQMIILENLYEVQRKRAALQASLSVLKQGYTTIN